MKLLLTTFSYLLIRTYESSIALDAFYTSRRGAEPHFYQSYHTSTCTKLPASTTVGSSLPPSLKPDLQFVNIVCVFGFLGKIFLSLLYLEKHSSWHRFFSGSHFHFHFMDGRISSQRLIFQETSPLCSVNRWISSDFMILCFITYNFLL